MRNSKSKRLAGNSSKFSPVKLLRYMVATSYLCGFCSSGTFV